MCGCHPLPSTSFLKTAFHSPTFPGRQAVLPLFDRWESEMQDDVTAATQPGRASNFCRREDLSCPPHRVDAAVIKPQGPGIRNPGWWQGDVNIHRGPPLCHLPKVPQLAVHMGPWEACCNSRSPAILDSELYSLGCGLTASGSVALARAPYKLYAASGLMFRTAL